MTGLGSKDTGYIYNLKKKFETNHSLHNISYQTLIHNIFFYFHIKKFQKSYLSITKYNLLQKKMPVFKKLLRLASFLFLHFDSFSTVNSHESFPLDPNSFSYYIIGGSTLMPLPGSPGVLLYCSITLYTTVVILALPP